MNMTKLPNAPLQEVVFEIRWELQVDSSSLREFDENFEFALGIFKQLITDSFPIYKRKAISNDSTPYQVAHQFWSGDHIWPVLQIGPGILTINETDAKYDWQNTFLPLIQSTVTKLNQAYSGNQKYILANLRYIDAVSISSQSPIDLANVISKSLKVSITNDFEIAGKLNYVNVNQSFILEDGSQVELVISTGTDHDLNPALIWQTAVSKRSVFDSKSLFDWVEQAHEKSSAIFHSQTSGKLYESFR